MNVATPVLLIKDEHCQRCGYIRCQCASAEEVSALIGKPHEAWVEANICTYHCVRDCSCWYWWGEQRELWLRKVGR